MNVDGSRGLRFNRVSLALAAAVEGQGVVLSLEQLAMDDLQKGRLVTLFDYRAELKQAYHVITLKDIASDERVTVFKQWLFDEVRRNDSSIKAVKSA